MKRPNWYTDENEKSWDRVKVAFRNDWEQTKHDFGSKSAPDLKQDVDDTVKQAIGKEDPFDRHEDAFRFGYGANRHFRTQYPTWNEDLESRLRGDYGDEFDRDRAYIRRAYEYRWPSGTMEVEEREERRL